MTRWQLDPRAYREIPVLDAFGAVARTEGASNPRAVYPMMFNGGRSGCAKWRGNNQPLTVSFTGDEAAATAVRKAFGVDRCFVTDRATGYSR